MGYDHMRMYVETMHIHTHMQYKNHYNFHVPNII